MTAVDETNQPGKTRTWWHPLLVRLLEHELSPIFEVRNEVSVGTLPLRADIVLVRRDRSEPFGRHQNHLPALVPRLNRWTLIEFKSPVDALQRGDLDRLLGVAHLFCGQQPESLPSEDLSLVVLAPSRTEPFLDEAKIRGVSLVEEEAGVLRLDGGFFAMWLLETDRLVGPDEPVLAVVSRVFLREGRRIMDSVRGPDSDSLLLYAIQQIEQFQKLGADFMLQHTHTAEMDQEYAALEDAFIRSLSPDERVAGLSPEERVAGLDMDELLNALTPDQRQRLTERLAGGPSQPSDE
jgi:hypothetical protein